MENCVVSTPRVLRRRGSENTRRAGLLSCSRGVTGVHASCTKGGLKLWNDCWNPGGTAQWRNLLGYPREQNHYSLRIPPHGRDEVRSRTCPSFIGRVTYPALHFLPYLVTIGRPPDAIPLIPAKIFLNISDARTKRYHAWKHRESNG